MYSVQHNTFYTAQMSLQMLKNLVEYNQHTWDVQCWYCVWPEIKSKFILICTLKFFENNKIAAKQFPRYRTHTIFVFWCSWCNETNNLPLGTCTSSRIWCLLRKYHVCLKITCFDQHRSKCVHLVSLLGMPRITGNIYETIRMWKNVTLNNAAVKAESKKNVWYVIFQHLHQLPFAMHVYNPPQW